MIFISAGHNTKGPKTDPGAIGINDVKEADLTIEFRDMVVAELIERKAPFISDMNSETLAQYIKRMKPGSGSAVCEFHFNASANPNARGAEVLVRNKPSVGSMHVANLIQEALTSVGGFINRGIKKESDSARGRLAILNTAAGIAVLPEICFITNAGDMEHYHANKGKLAARIADILIEADALAS